MLYARTNLSIWHGLERFGLQLIENSCWRFNILLNLKV